MRFLFIWSDPPIFTYGFLAESLQSLGHTVHSTPDNASWQSAGGSVSQWDLWHSKDGIPAGESKDVRDYDVVFCPAFPRAVPHLETLGRDKIRTFIMVDGADSHYQQMPEMVRELKPDLVLKHHYPQYADYGENYLSFPDFIPNPVMEIIEEFDIKERDIRIYAPFKNTNPLRLRIWEELKTYHGVEGCCDDINGHYPYIENLRNLRRSQIVIVPHSMGLGCGCLFYEALAAGCLVVTDNYRIQMDNPFIDRKHLVYWYKDEWFRGDLDWALNLSEDERTLMGMAGREHLRAYHTATARAQMLLERLR